MAHFARIPPSKTVFAVLVLIFMFSNFAHAEQQSEYDGVWLRDMQKVRVGGQNAIWLQIGRPAASNQTMRIDVDIYKEAPAKKFVLLQGPWAGAQNIDKFISALDNSLECGGWKLETINASSLSRSREKRILILPSGAWPASLMQKWKEIVGPNDLIVYIGVRQNQVLQENGSIAIGGVREELLAEGGEADSPLGGTRVQTEGGPAVWKLGRTLNEFENLRVLADEIVAYTISGAGNERPQHATMELKPTERSIVVRDGPYYNLDEYVRIILRDSKGKIARVWDKRAAKADGEIDGPAQIQMGKTAGFQIRILPQYRQSERINYEAVIYGPDFGEAHRQLLDERTIEPGQAWLGSFTYDNWSHGGVWRIAVEDQFARVYAAALLNVVEYKVIVLEPLAGSTRIQILRDGTAMANEEILIRQAGGEWKAVRLHAGVAEFEINGIQKAQIEIEVDGVVLSAQINQTADAWSEPLRWGAGVLIVAAILFLVFRPRAREIYRIHLPNENFETMKKIQITPKRLMEIVWEDGKNLVLNAEEAAQKLQKTKINGQAIITGVEETERALDKLVEKKLLSKYREWYGPQKREGEVRTLALMRILHDYMLSSGIKPRQIAKKGMQGYFGPLGREWIIFQTKEWKTLLGKQNLPAAVVFATKEEKEKFEQTIADTPGARADRLKLAIETKHTRLLSIDELR